ncbi:MAG: leucine--tRNA ligase [SAR202 cluster bacterium]|nr:leucine--tRNA ligase [SAR202 cluster bacterium]MQG36247.1 leucine--tRNA ligase [SAR202 cluster bacterium]MQG85949.1 leucine--tRNA ligase [SAR202 cluster bacterium]|tara:strand:+ start:14778 stop:17261 length:2484 start_codon:yes stop_codon:yes gene_type:complete
MSISHNQVSLRYDPLKIDTKWQSKWADERIYDVDNKSDKPKWYEMTMYPYPSGDLHIGHWYAFSPSDCHARFRRMQGYNVLHPIGFDAFGLPAENAAINRGIDPKSWTMQNISTMRDQLKSLGAVYDWSREVICCNPEYYEWNQWLFLKFFEQGLAYKQKAPVVWCPSCNTVLANEQVVNGNCERCDTVITRKDLEQWFLKITDYADELLDFDGLIEWPEKILTMQRNWIGKSEGVEIQFDLINPENTNLTSTEITTFTTRIDTIFGVTFMAIAPEHELVDSLTTKANSDAVKKYIEQARKTSEIDRLSTEKVKTGQLLGSYAINRFNGAKIPIYIADYVLPNYGTGAVMGVPAHDDRDFVFASNYGIDIVQVVSQNDETDIGLAEAYVEDGKLINSGEYSGLNNRDAIKVLGDQIELKKWGKKSVTYRIRDWLISRQRYWGTPIPMVTCKDCGIQPVETTSLPVELPPNADFTPSGESPLAKIESFVKTTCPKCGGVADRETDTMDTFFDSSWYMYRYLNPKYKDGPFENKEVDSWMPVDQYTGGAEHAVMHLLYSRFFTKALRDMGLVDFDEPFLRLYNQGIILGQDHEKMSKSRGNVINPDDVVGIMGADAVRVFLMFIGPWDQGGPWSNVGINGVARWLNRIWGIASEKYVTSADSVLDHEMESETQQAVHKTIKKVYEDLDKFKFNTAIAALMELSNHLTKVWNAKNVSVEVWNDSIKQFLLMLAPIAPHLSEELWEMNGYEFSIHNQNFPDWEESLVVDESITLIVQINGKLRDTISVDSGISEEMAQEAAMSSEKIQGHINGTTVKKVIYVPDRLINIVV